MGKAAKTYNQKQSPKMQYYLDGQADVKEVKRVEEETRQQGRTARALSQTVSVVKKLMPKGQAHLARVHPSMQHLYGTTNPKLSPTGKQVHNNMDLYYPVNQKPMVPGANLRSGHISVLPKRQMAVPTGRKLQLFGGHKVTEQVRTSQAPNKGKMRRIG